jgi:hypothetical protein
MRPNKQSRVQPGKRCRRGHHYPRAPFRERPPVAAPSARCECGRLGAVLPRRPQRSTRPGDSSRGCCSRGAPARRRQHSARRQSSPCSRGGRGPGVGTDRLEATGVSCGLAVRPRPLDPRLDMACRRLRGQRRRRELCGRSPLGGMANGGCMATVGVGHRVAVWRHGRRRRRQSAQRDPPGSTGRGGDAPLRRRRGAPPEARSVF